jgi:hypothetical protein
MLHVSLPAKTSVFLTGCDELRFSRFDLRREVVGRAGVESEILLVSVSRRWAFAIG